MTFSEFNRECQLFECSKEYFDLFKEASELDLMSLFIKQQIYIAENTDAASMVGDGYLTESVGNELSSVEDTFFEKSEKFVSKIRKSVAAICKTIAKFFKALAAKAKKLFSDNPVDQKELEQEDPETLKQKVSKVGRFISDHKAAAAGAATAALVGVLATSHAVATHIPKYLKNAVDASAKELGLTESQTAVLLNIANAARNGDKFATASIKSDKKILGVDQVSKLKDMLDYAVRWIERTEGVSINKINFEPILAGGNGISNSIVIANNPKMYEKIADDFESIHQSIVKIEEFNVRKQYHKRESNDQYRVSEHYVNINDDRDVIIGSYNVRCMERDHQALLGRVAALHEWIAETQKFYAEWDKVLTVAHMSFFERKHAKAAKNDKNDKNSKAASKDAKPASNDGDQQSQSVDTNDTSEKSEVKKGTS